MVTGTEETSSAVNTNVGSGTVSDRFGNAIQGATGIAGVTPGGSQTQAHILKVYSTAQQTMVVLKDVPTRRLFCRDHNLKLPKNDQSTC